MWYPLLVEGTPFGRYRLLDLLGAGAMGEVHRAYDTGTDRLVAVKVLAREFAHDAVYRKRFQREAQVAARLAEPHIVPIHDFGEIDGRLYLDMRLVQAPNLAELLAERDRLEVGEAVEVIAQIAAALDAAHAEGLVHRDVKPSNILVTPKGFAYLIDFGIARSDEDTTVTTTGAVIGTFAYMAPERLADDESGTRSDVYSLACVLYECLVGAKPYRGESMQRQIAAHLNEEPPLPSNAGVPRPFDAVIAKGMAKYPSDRYETAGELAAAARAALWEPPTEESPVRASAPASDPALPESETRDPHTPPPGTPVSPAEPTPVAAANPAPITTPDPIPITTPDPTPVAFSDPTPVAISDPTPVTAPESTPVAAPTPRPPWRAIIVMSVLALAVAGTSALALTRDNSTLVTETPEKAPPALSSTIRRPATSTPGPMPSGPPPVLAPPVSVTESAPVMPVAPGGPVADPPPLGTEPGPQPSMSPPPPVTTTPPPPVTTTTTEPTESETTTPETTTPETTTPVTTTPETTTPETTVTTTEEEGEEVAEDGSADATGSTIATSSAVGPTDGTALSPSGGSATETTASSPTGAAVDTTTHPSTTGATEGTTTAPTNGTGQPPAPAPSTDRITATPSTAADPG
ncbi:serine/threonine-protein kinase [Nocardia carnea]|uniref:serine/threonine-protein kinase n=1 Tax=Nocardia carnea TaxID=37328 RepID=UPI0024587AA4|nr:serine/threonine protein kinase [Nocardia carnea]